MALPTATQDLLRAQLAKDPNNRVIQNLLQSGSLFGAQTATAAAPPTNPFALIDRGNYAAPTKGTARGSAGFNSGLPPSIVNEYGGGLWGQGLDVNDPNIGHVLWEFHRQKLASDDTDYKKRVPAEIAKHGYDINSKEGLVKTVDWYYRDLARRMGKSNNFFDSTIGKILGTIGQVGLGFVPGVGPALSAGLGGYLGSRNDGGVLGGLLGAAGGYGAGSLGSSLATNGIAGTVSNTVNGVKGFFGGAPTASSAASAGVGAGGALNSINQFFPADIAARSLSGAALLADTTGRLAPVLSAAGIAGAAGAAGAAGGSGTGAAASAASAASAAGAGGGLLSNIGSIANIAAAAIPLLSASGSSPTQPTIADNTGASDNAARNINVTFADQGDYYERLRKSLYDYHKDGLDRDYKDESRELKFELARRGHLGGSPEIDASGRQRQLYDDGKLRIQGIADNAVSQAKVNDQNTKQNAISNIYAGMDQTQALNNQVAQSQLQSQQITEAAKGQNIGDTFGQLGYLYSQGQQGKAARRVAADYATRRGGGVGTATSGGGQVYHG